MSRAAHPKPSPAERAHRLVLMQEARRRRLERLIERALDERAEYAACMEGETYYPPSVLRNHWDRWELAALTSMNSGRPRWRLCLSLPTSRYEARSCNRYATRPDSDHAPGRER